MKLHPLAAMVTTCVIAQPACAQQAIGCDKSYGFRADVAGTLGQTLCSSRSSAFLDAVENFTLSNAGYTQISPAAVQSRFNDVGVQLNYSQNSNTLSYRFVELGEVGSFTGANRDESERLFVDFLKKSDIIGRIMKYQALHSATSALTGVGGAIPMAGAADFAANFDPASQIIGAGGSEAANNLIGIGLGYGSYNVSGSGDKVKATTVPLFYSIRNGIDPRRQLVFSLPLALVRVGDADTYHGGLGVSYRFPITDHWTLAPGAKYSIVASKDRATVSTVMSASLMSTYVIPVGSAALAIGNMLGYYKTGKFTNRDYSFDPDIALTMTRNGAMYSMPTSMFERRMAAEISIIDTRYLGGDKPFVNNSQEIGVTVGTNRNASNARSFTRAGLSYVRGKASRGWTANVGYWF